MSKIKTNEREFSGKVAEWFQQTADMNTLPFKIATIEPGIKIDTRTKFGDIVLWRNLLARDAFSYLELKPPFAKKENLETFRQKALQLGVQYAYTWDFQNLDVYSKKDKFEKPIGTESTPLLKNINEWLRGDKQAIIKAYVQRICDELKNLHETGKFTQFKPEKVYFVNFIKNTVEKLLPIFEDFVTSQYSKKDVRLRLLEYFSKQGYAFTDRTEYIKLITKQRVYGLITKIIFYLTIRKYFNDLPDIDQSDEKDLNRSLRIAFVKAQEKDWQAVFEDDLIDDLGIPKNSFSILRDFFSELRVYHFENLADDVVGELFEEIIDPDQRHDLGQYFTNEYLVDLILASVVNKTEGYYLDPTCGSGTFLIRLYDRLHYLSDNRLTHNELLSKIWGIDIGKFPAELSTINLFRQSPKDFENFPRVVNHDIFNVNKNTFFKFPPPKAGKNFKKIELQVPQFSSIVGNFPFIRQELIEKNAKGYKKQLTNLLAHEYLFSYNKLFVTKNISASIFEEVRNFDDKKRIKYIDQWVEKGNITLKLSGQADIYTYIFIHTATMLSKNGTFAIITSNSWLDVAYGTVLKEFFIEHFKIKTIIASWAEPWFDDAAVNTVVTVLEKEDDENKRKENKIKFVKLKTKLSELIPYNDLKLERINRWRKVEDIIDTIEQCDYHKQKIDITETLSTFENDNMRVRIVKQNDLQIELQIGKEATKWMQYLRAPNIYFELLNNCKDKLDLLANIGKIKRGITTGINDFFYFKKVKVNNKVSYVNGRNIGIKFDNNYLKKIITSPKETEYITIDESKVENYVLICDKNKKELKKEGSKDLLEYIEWGQKQKTPSGVSWPEVPSVKSRENWWSIDGDKTEKILFPRFFDKKFCFPDLSKSILVGDTFFEFRPHKKEGYKNKNFINSTIYHLFVEILGRSNMGDGVLTFYGPDIESTYLLKDEIDMKYKKNIERPILSIFEEVSQKDRKELDTAVLNALGLNAKDYLPRIYDGICEMVKERLELSKMRKGKKKQAQKSEYTKIKQTVIEDCIIDSIKTFPMSFYRDYNKLEFKQVSTTGKHLNYEPFFNTFIIKDTDKKTILETVSKDEAEFAVILSYQKSTFMLNVPIEEKALNQIISSYINYVNNIKNKIQTDANHKLHDWALADKMAKEILVEYNLIEL